MNRNSCALVCAVTLGCVHAQLPARAQPLAIVGATVVQPQQGGEAIVRPNWTVIVSGERIEAVGPAATVVVPPGALVIARPARTRRPA